jgi:peptide/nickel transport system permease protein
MIILILRRVVLALPTLLFISMVSFAIIQLPPGDFVTTTVSQWIAQGESVNAETEAMLRARYGVDQPVSMQYLKWLRNIIRGDLGVSWAWAKPIGALVAERLPWSLLVSCVSLLFVYLVAIPIGVLSATRQYTLSDYAFTFVGFIGLAIPNFLFALIFLWLFFLATGNSAVGLFSRQYLSAPWSVGKVFDLLKHLIIPVIIVGTAGTASLIRVMRANLLDELKKQYVIVARAKGLAERKLLFRYPVRMAINPIVSTVGWTLPALVNGELLTSIVLGLPTLAPVLLQSLLTEDLYLAGSIIFILSILTVVGTLLSDLLLVWADPRIRDAV